jgi:hypothetical protein
MTDGDPSTEELRRVQRDREQTEAELAQAAPDAEESAQHERRADKARYLREKLRERSESEQRS